jgi:RNA recognition motif-containing protein
MSSSPELKAEKKKRKHDQSSEEDGGVKLEIDVNLPEPPSKKAKRKEKKSKTKTEKSSDTKADETVEDADVHPARKGQVTVKKEERRSDHGIWIGNLSFKTTKDALRRFFLERGGIDDTSITRVHMPVDNNTKQNKGFAYVDFTTEAVLAIAMSMSEKLVDGRKVLIKNAKSFEGRPEKTKADEERKEKGFESKKPPSKRIFVGNLGFDMTRDELHEHFSQAGQVDDVFLATFEDSGKCKGFGWVTFAEVEAAEKAVKGYILKEQAQEEDDDDDDEEIVENDDSESEEEEKPQKKKRKPKKPMKWFINRIHGRTLRCEFAEDKQTRYQKRYGKGAGEDRPQRDYSGAKGNVHVPPESTGEESIENLAAAAAAAREAPKKRRDLKMKKLDKDQRQEERRKKHDPRLTAPGKALANAQRGEKATGAIVAPQGKKVTFD